MTSWDDALPGEVQLTSGRWEEVILLNASLSLAPESHQEQQQAEINTSLNALAEQLSSVKVDVLEEALKALAYVTHCPLSPEGGRNCRPIDAVVSAGMCPRIIELLLHESEYVWRPAFTLVWNITSGTARHKEATVNFGLLPALLKRLTLREAQGQQTKHDKVLAAVFAIVQNLTLASNNVVRAGLIDKVIRSGLLSRISQVASSVTCEDAAQSAASVVSISLAHGSLHQVEAFVNCTPMHSIIEHLHDRKETDLHLRASVAEAHDRIAAVCNCRRRGIHLVALRFGSPCVGKVIERFDVLCQFSKALAKAQAFFKAQEPKSAKPAPSTGRPGGA
mmetsp:Transcript_159360/g.281388  ORF Transcript_159360/g.281388 Transcript_159360/m.281388 type:complete len:335 (-) Transcript_159360:193-1197(-)